MAEKIALTEAGPEEWPICPSCKKELKHVKFKARGWLTTVTIFWCPFCRCLLGTSSTFNA